MTNPIFTYPHSVGNAITGGTFYQGSQFPGYAGRYFFADYTANWVNVLDPANGNTLSSFGGNVPSPVDLKVGSDGSLYYLSIGDGAVYRVSFGSTITPTPTATPAPGSPQTVTFDDIPAFNTNKPLQFEYPTGVISWVEGQWWLNGPSGLFNTQSASLQSGVTSGSLIFINPRRLVQVDAYNDDVNAASISIQCPGQPTRSFTVPAKQIATLAPAWTGTCAFLTISTPSGNQVFFDNFLHDTGTGNQPPVGTISAPAPGLLYSAGDTVTYAGSATDPEQGALSAGAFSWTIIFHHDTHTHPFLGPINGVTGGTFVIPRVGETSTNVFYRIQLTVTDSAGAQHISWRDIFPRTATITLQTSPAGAGLTLDGQPIATPFSVSSVVGMTRSIGAASPQNVGGQWYAFATWSDGGAATHSINTPAISTTYTALFTPAQLGGGGFGLSTAASMSWTAGTAQDGYQILRVSQAGSVTLPTGGMLPAAATSFTDPGPLPESLYCYILMPSIGSPPAALATSDVHCLVQSIAAGSSIPGNFTLRLQSGTAALSWQPTGGQDAFLLAALPLSGSGARFVQLSGLQTTASDNTGGAATCYVVFAMSSGAFLGNTNALCGVPGTGTISAASQRATTSTGAASTPVSVTPMRAVNPAVQTVARNADSVRQTVRE